MSGENIVHATDASFDADVLQSPLPTLVDFWAPWCGPCQMVGPVLEKMAAAKAGALKVVKVNVDDNGAVPQKYGVVAIPTLILFKGGEIKEKAVGYQTEAKLEALLAKHLG